MLTYKTLTIVDKYFPIIFAYHIPHAITNVIMTINNIKATIAKPINTFFISNTHFLNTFSCAKYDSHQTHQDFLRWLVNPFYIK